MHWRDAVSMPSSYWQRRRLEERGAFDDDARGALTFQAAHRSQSRFQAAVIGFDTIVGVLDCVMQRVRCQLIAFATAAARSVTTSDR